MKNKQPYTIKVLDITGERYCLYEKQARKVYSIIFDACRKNEKVLISFSGIWLVNSDFIHDSIGELLAHYNMEILKTKISFSIPKEVEYLKELIPLVLSNHHRLMMDEKHRSKLLKAYEKFDREKNKNAKKNKRELCERS